MLLAAALARVKELAEEIVTPPSVLVRQWIVGYVNGAVVDRRGDKE